MSLVQGAWYYCLSPVLYNALVKGIEDTSVSVEHVYDPELKLTLNKSSDAQSIKEGYEIMSKYKLDTIRELAGTLRPFKAVEDFKTVVRQTAKWYTLGRTCSS